jgi:prophage regulatory protein
MLPEILRNSAFLRERDITSLISVSSSTLYRWIARGEFPAPLALSAGVKVWSTKAVSDWVTARVAERPDFMSEAS